jgi:hypothetical protein
VIFKHIGIGKEEIKIIKNSGKALHILEWGVVTILGACDLSRRKCAWVKKTENNKSPLTYPSGKDTSSLEN